jgi:tetratricopeptide (TPR) repeat protein
VLFQLGRNEEAQARLEHSLEIAPDELITLRLAARFAAGSGDWPAAARYWERAFEERETSVNSATAYVGALLRLEKPIKARQLFHKFNDQWPDDVRLMAAGAFAAEAVEEHGEAFELWKAASDLDPSAFNYRRRAIRALLGQGRFEAAGELAAAYQVEAGDAPEAVALAETVVAAAAREGGPEALICLEKYASEDSAPWARLIEKYLQDNDPESAESVFQRAMDLQLDSVAVVRGGANISTVARRRDLELERWPELAKRAPEDVQVLRRNATIFSGEGRMEEALAYAEQGLAIDPSDEGLLRTKGNLNLRLGQFETALATWKDYGDLFGLSASVMLSCARCLRGLGRTDEADHLITATVKEHPDDIDLAMDHARAAQFRGDLSEAEERWRRAIEIVPENDLAWTGLIQTLTRLGAHDRRDVAVKQAQERATSKKSMSSSTTAAGA